MKHKFLTLLVALCATTALWASNTITYTATEKLTRSTLNVGATTFGPAITSHDFSNGIGTITCSGYVTTIGSYAFSNCVGLTSITIPNSVTRISTMAFTYCTKLASITIPYSVAQIGADAFCHCRSLTSVTIPNSDTKIMGDNTFYLVNNIVYNGTATGSPWGAKCINGYVDGYLVYSDATKTILCGCSSAATGEVAIPNSVTEIGECAFAGCSDLTSITISNSVATIGEYAFWNCPSLTSVTIPVSVSSIGKLAFYESYGLTSIDVDPANTHYSSIDGVLFNYTKDTLIQYPASNSRTEYIIPNSVTTIEHYAFYGCSSLTSVTIPNSVTGISTMAFYDCTSLTSVTIPVSVSSIGNMAFAACFSLQSVTLENYFTSYNSNTFDSSATILYANPITVSIIDKKICSVTAVMSIPSVYNDWYDEIGLSSSNKYIHAAANIDGEINFADGPFSNETYYLYAKKSTTYEYKDAIQVSTILPTLSCSMSSQLTSISFSNISSDTDESVETFSKGIKYNNHYYEADENDCVILNDIIPNKKCTVYVYGCYNGNYYEQSKIVSTKKPVLSCSMSSTQTTITLSNISASTDKFVKTLTKGIYYNGKRYEADNNNSVVLKEIAPNKQCTLQVYGCYNGTYYYGDEKCISTESVSPTISTSQLSSTTIYVRGSYTQGDATVLSTSLNCISTTNTPQGDEGYFTGLKPNTSYSFEYMVNTKEGGIYSTTKQVTTPALELTTLTPKIVSVGTAIVAASTNISDYETNVGFEWRKDNAPEGSASKSGAAIICNGVMEGRLLNLGTDWWKVRPYYEAADGTRYYGDWAYIDPTDASYFEPTVHTYAMPTSPTGNQVQVRGYVMTGTDEVTEQGFEYWFNSDPKAPSRIPAATPDSICRVTASGQVMTAVLKDLAYSTTYTCRAYAVADGKTYYGEEVQFLTPEDPRPIYTLTLDAGIGGQVNTEAAGQYREREQVTLRATADKGYVFVQWSDLNTENPRTITMTSDITLSAIFEESQPQDVKNVIECDQNNVNKFLRNGQVIIRKNNKTYNTLGQEIK